MQPKEALIRFWENICHVYPGLIILYGILKVGFSLLKFTNILLPKYYFWIYNLGKRIFDISVIVWTSETGFILQSKFPSAFLLSGNYAQWITTKHLTTSSFSLLLRRLTVWIKENHGCFSFLVSFRRGMVNSWLMLNLSV